MQKVGKMKQKHTSTSDFLQNCASHVANLLRDAITPHKPLTVTEWAEENRILTSEGSSEPGRYRVSRTPFAKEIMDSLSVNSIVQKTVWMAGSQVSKAIDILTPIPTRDGWKVMDEIEIGDVVYDENGKECNVLGVSSTKYGQDCYRFRFSDGSIIIADKYHLWTLITDTGLRIEGTSESIYESMYNFTFYLPDGSGRTVESVTETNTTPVKCIKTDSQSELYLAGLGKIPTHNTESGLNWMGYIMDFAPAPTLFVINDKEMVEEVVKTRVDPMIKNVTSIHEKIRNMDVRGRGDTRRMKQFPGGYISFIGANNPGKLANKPIRFVYLDEIDRFPYDVGGEGDAVNLAITRTRTFKSKRKILITSTPTIEGASRIADEYRNTDMRKFFVPCPYCGHMQELVWGQIKYTLDNHDNILEVWYECLECSQKIYNHQKDKMLKGGEWRATNPDFKDKTVRGYHLSALYAPVGWDSWEDYVSQYLQSKTSDTKMKTFWNTVLGLPYERVGDVPNWEVLFERSTNSRYERGIVPNEALFLTAGADVQGDRIECEVVGWGREGKSYSIDYYVFAGDTKDPNSKAWQGLADVLRYSFPREDGHVMHVAKMAVDRGYRSSVVDTFCMRYSRERVHPIHGKGRNAENMQIPISNKRQVSIKVNKNTRRTVSGYFFYIVGSSHLKDELYGRLNLPFPSDARSYPYGWCFFPNNYDQNYFRMLTAERYVPPSRAGERGKWVCSDGVRNEAIDCRNYARAMAYAIGYDEFNEDDYKQLESQFTQPLIKSANRRRVIHPGVSI